VAVNFNREERAINIKIPVELLTQFGLNGEATFTDLLSGDAINTADAHNGIPVVLKGSGGLLLQF
jgi:hypothetical protein